MIVGGYAVAFHGYPRFTKDIDVFFERSAENIARVRCALCAFGFREDELTDAMFLDPDSIISFGVTPVRVDFMGDIDGVPYHEAKSRRVRGTYGTVEVNFIGRLDLIKNKLATKRTRDKADAEELSAITDGRQDRP